MNKTSAIADKPFSTMNVNTSKRFYTQSQRQAARVLFILCLIVSGPRIALAIPSTLVAQTAFNREALTTDQYKNLTDLWNAWQASGKAIEAKNFYEYLLKICEHFYPETPYHPDIATTLNNLGIAWLVLGYTSHAASFFERALAIYNQFYPETPYHTDIARTLNNLGTAWRASGDARKAVIFLERALAIYDQVYKATPNHPDIASTLNNLGNACLTLWDWGEAERNFGQAAGIFYNLAAQYHASSDLNKAVRLYQHALENYKLAAQDYVSRDLNKAVSLYQHALKNYKLAAQDYVSRDLNKLDNSEKVDKVTYHPGMAKALVGLGEACFTLKADEAKRCFELAASMFYKLAKNDRTSGNADGAERHFGLAAGMFYKSAAQYHASGDLNKAVSLYEHALKNYEEVPKETPHLAKAKVLVDLGDAWGALGNAYQAVTVYQEALNNLGNSEQGYQNILVRVQTNLNKAQQALDQANKDAISYEQALGNCETTPNAMSCPAKAKALVDLGNTCLTLGNAAEAIKCYTSALEIYQRIHASGNGNSCWRHPDIASTLENLGKAYQALGKVEEAQTYYSEACIMRNSGIAPVMM